MSRFLILDVGAGTLDILCYDTDSGLHFKAVAKSPVVHIADRIKETPGKLLVLGVEMGGGPVSRVLHDRAQHGEVIISRSAAATIHHNMERVHALGLRVMEDREAEELRDDGGYQVIFLRDLEVERLEEIIRGLGIPFAFDVVGVCAQDHGVPPEGVSHLDYRHSIFQARLDQNPFPHALLFRDDEIPPTLNRLKAIAATARTIPAREIYVMDSGMAAILGASMDKIVRENMKVLVMDVATSHTVGAALDGEELSGFFEYHTQDITLERLESLLMALADGKLDHTQVLKEGGHGAYIRKSIGFKAIDFIVATGPKRKMLETSSLPIFFGAPLGDNMMTGTVGVLEAIRRHKKLDPIAFL